MYATITRRKADPARQRERGERAEKEFLPRLRKASGFVAFYVVQETPEMTVAFIVWENKAHADAFQEEAADWQQTLEQMGSKLESRSDGEVLLHTTAHQ